MIAATLPPPGDRKAAQEPGASARSVVRRYTRWAAVAGMIPLPWFDIAVLAGVQIKMLAQLAATHKLPFSRARARAIGGTLVASLASGWFAVLLNPLQMIPFIGPWIGFFVCGLCSGATTYALGRVAARQFASEREREDRSLNHRVDRQ